MARGNRSNVARSLPLFTRSVANDQRPSVSRPQFRILLLTVLLFAAVASMQRPSSAAQPTQQSPSFRAGVDVVSLSVTVTDRMNRYVTEVHLPEFSAWRALCVLWTQAFSDR
jgi:uncharacterized lipoprotein YajG